jgi:hypothetical protein
MNVDGLDEDVITNFKEQALNNRHKIISFATSEPFEIEEYDSKKDELEKEAYLGL